MAPGVLSDIAGKNHGNGGEYVKIQIFQINVNDGRRKVDLKAVQRLADSISQVGLLNPITVDREYTLIAGLHRLEAVKMLGWSEIACTAAIWRAWR